MVLISKDVFWFTIFSLNLFWQIAGFLYGSMAAWVFPVLLLMRLTMINLHHPYTIFFFTPFKKNGYQCPYIICAHIHKLWILMYKLRWCRWCELGRGEFHDVHELMLWKFGSFILTRLSSSTWAWTLVSQQRLSNVYCGCSWTKF